MHSFAAPQTRDQLDALIWAIGLFLQLALLTVLIQRGIASRVKLFTALIALYLLRSVVLYLGFGIMAAEAYHQIYELSQMLAILTELVLATNIALMIVRSANRPARQARAAAAATLAFSAVLWTWWISSLIPARAGIPLDRAQILFALLMLLLWGWSRIVGFSLEPARTVLSGFALYGAANIAVALGRAQAAIRHNPLQFAAWSYVLSAAYLAIVIFWIINLLQTPRGASNHRVVASN
jgi:hypothetical protein